MYLEDYVKMFEEVGSEFMHGKALEMFISEAGEINDIGKMNKDISIRKKLLEIYLDDDIMDEKAEEIFLYAETIIGINKAISKEKFKGVVIALFNLSLFSDVFNLISVDVGIPIGDRDDGLVIIKIEHIEDGVDMEIHCEEEEENIKLVVKE